MCESEERCWRSLKMEATSQLAVVNQMIESEVENWLWDQKFIFNEPPFSPDLNIQESQNMFTKHCPVDWPSQLQGFQNEDISALGEFYDIFSSCPSPPFSEISTDSTDSLEIEQLTPFIKMGLDSYCSGGKQLPTTYDTNTNPLPSIERLLSGFAQEPVLLGNVPCSNGLRSGRCEPPDNNRNSVTVNDFSNGDEGGDIKKLNTNKDKDSERTLKKRKYESADNKENNESTWKKKQQESDDNKNVLGNIKKCRRDFPEAQRQPSSSYTATPSLEFKNLQSTYFKVQKRTLIASEQRLADSRVSMLATSTVPIQSFQVSVKRCENGKPENDTLGPVRLSAKQELDEYDGQVQKIQFSVDLDSVYRTKEGLEVYSLKKTNIHLANTWHLLVILQLSDGCFEVFESKPFLIKTRRYKNDAKIS